MADDDFQLNISYEPVLSVVTSNSKGNYSNSRVAGGKAWPKKNASPGRPTKESAPPKTEDRTQHPSKKRERDEKSTSAPTQPLPAKPKHVPSPRSQNSPKSSPVQPISNDSLHKPTIPSTPRVSTYQPRSIEEDPHQFHARPRDLSKNALSRPQAKVNSTRIFTERPFSSLGLDDRLTTHLEKSRDCGGLGLTSTTKIQNVVIPSILESRSNILMKSETGSGKTLAYLIPIMNDLMTLSVPVNRSQGTYAVILTPTRELCSQIYDILELLTKCYVHIVSGCLIGGEKRKSEKARLRKGVSIVVGTPGRFLDHIKTTESFNLNTLRWFVLDEADRLLDMGFGQTILEICSILTGQDLATSTHTSSLPAKSNSPADKSAEARTNLNNKWHQQALHRSKLCNNLNNLCYMMASATLTAAVKQLAMPLMSGKGFLVIDGEHERVDIVHDINDLAKVGKDKGRLDGLNTTMEPATDGDDGNQIEKMTAPEQLSQYFMMTTCKWKLSALISFIQLHKNEKLMVFFSTCDGVDYHSLLMNATAWPEALDTQTINDKSDSNTLKLPVKHSLEPLDYSFTGLFGPDTPLYRLHGNVPQKTRQQVYKSFCNADKGVLFCTDVAARGLDLPKIDWIVQYDPPCETTDYIHRIGRTARRGLGGNAIIFLLPSEIAYLQLLQSHGMSPLPLSLQNLFLEASNDIPGSKKFQNIDEMMAVIIQRRVENTIAQNGVLMDAGKQAFCSFIRAYATHSSDAKGIFKVQSLHLGHVAKSFGLRESPSVLRCKEDTIGKVFNGHYRAEIVESEKKKRRDEKYSLSGMAAAARRKDGKSKDGKNMKKRSREGGGGGGQGEGERTKKRVKEDDSSSTSAGEANKKKPKAAVNKNEKQKLRKIGSDAGPSPSGAFRKTSGYFRKKLRTESKSEFAH